MMRHALLRQPALLQLWKICILALMFVALAAPPCRAQDTDAPSATKAESVATTSRSGQQLPVNWLYGAYIPTEAPLEPLSGADRWHLYVRQGFTTPGIYVKTVLFTVSDQARDSPPGWPQDPEGFAKRVGTRYAQFLMQNSFTAVGDAVPGWEPRYDLCRNCTSVGQRIKHAIVRNFVTYGSDEKSLRPQVFLYAGSFGGAAMAALWQPYRPSPVVKGALPRKRGSGFCATCSPSSRPTLSGLYITREVRLLAARPRRRRA